MDINIINSISLLSFWLAFSKWIGIILLFPLFDHISVPSNIKILLSLLLTYVFYNSYGESIVKDLNYVGKDNFWFVTVFYTFSGLLLGFVNKVMFSFINSAGSIIGQNIGFGAIKYFDPSRGQSEGTMEKILFLSILILLLNMGVLNPFLKISLEYFNNFTLVNLNLSENLFNEVLTLITELFLSCLILSVPILITNFSINLIMGITARMVPQMNILMISFIVNISVGLFIMSNIIIDVLKVGTERYIKLLEYLYSMVI